MDKYFEILDSKIKRYEAEYKVTLEDIDDAPVYEVLVSFDAYVTEDEAYPEDIEISFFLGDQEVHPDRAEYKKLIDKIESDIEQHVLDNACDYAQDRYEAEADRAYDAWKDSLMEQE